MTGIDRMVRAGFEPMTETAKVAKGRDLVRPPGELSSEDIAAFQHMVQADPANATAQQRPALVPVEILNDEGTDDGRD